MTLTNINSIALRGLIKLTERKESLVREIKKIEAQIAYILAGKTLSTAKTVSKSKAKKHLSRTGKKSTVAAKKPTLSSAKRAPRGTMKKKIFAALRAAGDPGLKVPELSKKIGVKSQNVHVWFSSTGKNLPEIKRVGKGHFKLNEK